MILQLQPLIETSLKTLDDSLIRHFGATAPTFAARAEAIAATLPDEVAQPLRALAAEQARLLAAAEPDLQAAGDFCFAAGALHEKLRAVLQTQMEMESAIIGPGSVSAIPLQRAQSEQVSRLIEARDRLFRKVADLTLKFLLIGLGLLMLGLMLGLI